jgi:nucleoside-diphosphate-sugar epimerase
VRILLAAGSGFIGAPTASLLLDRGNDVAVLHRGQTDRGLPRHIERLTRLEDAARISWDVVIHFRLLNADDARAALTAFRDCKRLVAISSGDVYRAYGQLLGHDALDSTPSTELTEDAPLRLSRFPYGRLTNTPWGELIDYEKIDIETIVQNSSLDWTILRLPKVFGPGASGRPLMRWIEWLRAHTEIPVGDCQGRWRWTHSHVQNVAAAIALAAVHPSARNRIYNVGEASTPTQRQRVLDLASVMNWRGSVLDVRDDSLPPELRDGHGGAPDLAYDTSRIRVELGYAESFTYEDSLRSLL